MATVHSMATCRGVVTPSGMPASTAIAIPVLVGLPGDVVWLTLVTLPTRVRELLSIAKAGAEASRTKSEKTGKEQWAVVFTMMFPSEVSGAISGATQGEGTTLASLALAAVNI